MSPYCTRESRFRRVVAPFVRAGSGNTRGACECDGEGSEKPAPPRLINARCASGWRRLPPIGPASPGRAGPAPPPHWGDAMAAWKGAAGAAGAQGVSPGRKRRHLRCSVTIDEYADVCRARCLHGKILIVCLCKVS